MQGHINIAGIEQVKLLGRGKHIKQGTAGPLSKAGDGDIAEMQETKI